MMVCKVPDSLLLCGAQRGYLHLDHDTHQYTWFNFATCQDVQLDSVTRVIKQYSHEFDAESHSNRIAERDGIDAAALRAKWAADAAAAADHGMAIHNEIQQICSGIQNDGYARLSVWKEHDKKTASYLRGVWNWVIKHIEIAQGFLVPEFLVCNPEWRIAGTVDLIASTYNGVLSIIDWKTNKRMDVDGYSNMKPPFQRGKLALPDANLYHYFLQLNFYRRILAVNYGYEADRMVVVHLEGNGNYHEYDVPEMDAHIDKILELRSKID